MDQFGQNQFAPGMKSSLFLPDQLVAGTLQLVTDTGIITGGTYTAVLGMVTASGKYTSVKTATDGSETRWQFWLIMLMHQLRSERRPVSDGRVQPEPHHF
jgi:hypothetical protein